MQLHTRKYLVEEYIMKDKRRILASFARIATLFIAQMSLLDGRNKIVQGICVSICAIAWGVAGYIEGSDLRFRR